MNPEDIREILLEIFKKYSKASREYLLSNKPLMEVMDSLTLIEIIFQIEENFKIKVEDEEIARLKCFEDVVNGISLKLSQDAAG
ncbi:MAG: acyl carrier protein [Spirochaetia bacterium]|nr:acyl carrier protein [Spirochaetia bacterium]